MPLNKEIEARILDCLRRAKFDISAVEITKQTRINRNTVSKYLMHYVDIGTVNETRALGKAKLYRLVLVPNNGLEMPPILADETTRETSSLTETDQLQKLREQVARADKLRELEKKLRTIRFVALQDFREGVMTRISNKEYTLEIDGPKALENKNWLEEKVKEGKIKIL